MLSGSRDPDEIPAEEREMLQRLIDQTYDRFKSVVTDGRSYAHEQNKDEGKALASDWVNYADGRVLSGKEAHQLGFVDELGNFETAVNRAKELTGTPRANLVEYRLRVDIADLLGLFSQTESRVVKVDLGVETPKLEAGRLYFLSPSYLH
jgi:protease-4